MEPWRQHLESGFSALNKKTNRVVETVSDSLKAAMSNMECEHCQLKCFDADMLVLPCAHHHCNDCIGDQLERLVGFIERRYPLVNSDGTNGILVCSKCHEVCVVKQKTVFSGSLHSKDRGNARRIVFEIDQERTSKLRNGSEVRRGFENQRRTPLGRFCSSSLLPFERSAFTKSEKNEALDFEKIDHEMSQNKKCWIEDWMFDKSCGDPQGWQYATNWSNQKKDWSLEPSAVKFVRRRLLIRACVSEAALQGK
ncbi:Hypothetical protein, putative [Bodo saltans]|uniref:Zinc finger protein n=1 Tax=Bodo saltans TaxID=75058 RepID=A0A0S4JDW8_BODSA|nr:Hypothetical protein, putative [Bodo saltans]|eukprot:CUG87371.1 Hypothetical protein, putative [Bodo saltans]